MRQVILQVRWQCVQENTGCSYTDSMNGVKGVVLIAPWTNHIHSHSWSNGAGWWMQPYRFDGLVQGCLLQLQLALFILVKVIPTLEITLFVESRKSVGHFLNAAAVVYSLSLCPTEARCGGEDGLRWIYTSLPISTNNFQRCTWKARPYQHDYFYTVCILLVWMLKC